jgi:hypothetical protein
MAAVAMVFKLNRTATRLHDASVEFYTLNKKIETEAQQLIHMIEAAEFERKVHNEFTEIGARWEHTQVPMCIQSMRRFRDLQIVENARIQRTFEQDEKFAKDLAQHTRNMQNAIDVSPASKKPVLPELTIAISPHQKQQRRSSWAVSPPMPKKVNKRRSSVNDVTIDIKEEVSVSV